MKTRLGLRDVRAAHVHAAMILHADEIATVRDVQRLPALYGLGDMVVAVAVADNAALGLVIGGTGGGRTRAVESGA